MDVDAPRSEYDTDENYAVDYSDLKPELRLAIDQAQRDRLDGKCATSATNAPLL